MDLVSARSTTTIDYDYYHYRVRPPPLRRHPSHETLRHYSLIPDSLPSSASLHTSPRMTEAGVVDLSERETHRPEVAANVLLGIKGLGVLPQDFSAMADAAVEDGDGARRALQRHRRGNPSRRHTVLQTAAKLPPHEEWEDTALEWALEDGSEGPEADGILDYVSLAMSKGVFHSERWLEALVDGRPRIVASLERWGEVDCEVRVRLRISLNITGTSGCMRASDGTAKYTDFSRQSCSNGPTLRDIRSGHVGGVNDNGSSGGAYLPHFTHPVAPT